MPQVCPDVGEVELANIWLNKIASGAMSLLLFQNNWTPAVLSGPAFDKFVDDEFALLRATMVKAGMV